MDVSFKKENCYVICLIEHDSDFPKFFRVADTYHAALAIAHDYLAGIEAYRGKGMKSMEEVPLDQDAGSNPNLCNTWRVVGDGVLCDSCDVEIYVAERYVK